MNGAVGIRRLRRSLECFRKFSSQAKPEIKETKVKIGKQFELDRRVEAAIENGTIHPRNHPGVVRKKADKLPAAFEEAMGILIEKRNKSDLAKEATSLSRQLWGRLMPPEERDYIEKIKFEKMQLQPLLKDLNIDEDESNTVKEKLISKHLKDIIHPWHPLNLTVETCLHYLLSRTPAEYCVLHKIFSEVCHKDPDFAPSTLFDFGSGLASGYWAVKEVWKNPLKEVFNVDSNLNMNEMATKILQITNTKFSAEDGVYFRQFFPVAPERTYDITLSAFSLLEVPSFKDRMEAVSLLWSKTKKYLIIVEDGTNAGYKAIIEARNLVTHLENNNTDEGGVHVVAPCTHEFLCPRFTHDNSPCNFGISYLTPKFLENKQVRMNHRYSYIVLKKGPRPGDDPQWPRCVRETHKHKKQVKLQLCTSEGKLEDVFLQKKHTCRNSYRCAKHTNWGDLLPGEIKEFEIQQPDNKAEVSQKNPVDC